MNDLEWFRLLFAVAFGMWIFADIVFLSRYIGTLIRARFRSPFILGTSIVATTCTFETTLYGYAVWFQAQNVIFIRWATFAIPIMIMVQALAFMLIANWVFTSRNEAGGSTHTAT